VETFRVIGERLSGPKVRFATDSPLEGGGFELSVPRCARDAARLASEEHAGILLVESNEAGIGADTWRDRKPVVGIEPRTIESF
jgi:hypothetical protein